MAAKTHSSGDGPLRCSHAGGFHLTVCMAILALACVSNLPLVYGQFHGDDEVMQEWVHRKMLQRLQPWRGWASLKEFTLLVSQEDQPPLSFAFSLVGQSFFPDSEFGLRAVSILFSLFMTFQVMRLGHDIGGRHLGYLSGLLVASSAVYNWTSRAFGWSVIVVMWLLCIRRLRRATLDLTDRQEVRTLRLVGFFLIVALLINPGSLLMLAMALLIYAHANRRRLHLVVRAAWPILLFLALYYGYFFAFVPWHAHAIAGADGIVGQLGHHLGRAGGARVNSESFLENMRGLNGHYFPYLAWVFFAGAAYWLARVERRILVWLTPFVLVWSFWFRGNTHQYMILASICLVPYGVAFLLETLSRRTFSAVVGTLAAAFALWNFVLFVRPYGATEYPERPWCIGFATRGYPHNIIEPYREIGLLLDSLLGPGERFVDDIDGSFAMFYYNDSRDNYQHSRRAGTLGSGAFPLVYDEQRAGYRLAFDVSSGVRAVVTRRELVGVGVWKRIQLPGSRICVYVLDTEPGSA